MTREEELILDRERLRAANSVHLQTLAMIARKYIIATDNYHEFAKQRLKLADEAAAKVKLEDLSVVTVPNTRVRK